MPWKESRVVNERAKFCLEWHERWDKAKGGRVDLAELCRVFGISRQTGCASRDMVDAWDQGDR